jgi:hydroxyacyl-ACP dehydratase HTD2-like protein with hotdog domain
MLDSASLGRSFGPYTVTVDEGQLRMLADVLGDVGLCLPPTFPTCYGLWANKALLAELDALGAPLPRLLHGEQRYSYHAPVAPGDTLTAKPRIAGLEQKAGRSGPFQLVTLETHWHNQRGELAVVDTLVVVVRG